MHPEWSRDGLLVTTDPARIDLEAVHAFLTESYWAQGIPRALVERSVQHSLCFSLLEDERQIGFARVVSDRATFAYLADVYVLASHRGRGLATWLTQCALAHPDLQGLRRWMLVTRDAHGVYRKVGFQDLAHPDRHLEIARPDLYRTSND